MNYISEMKELRRKARALIEREYREKLEAVDKIFGRIVEADRRSRPRRSTPYGNLKETVNEVISRAGIKVNFSLATVVDNVRQTIPKANSASISSAISKLNKQGKIKCVARRKGKIGALYRKA